MQTSSSRTTDKTKRRIRIVVSENNNNSLAASSVAPQSTSTSASAFTTSQHHHHHHHHQVPRESSIETKRLNIDYGDEGSGADWDKDREVLILSGRRNKNDKNWENWERIREQKLEKMKGICFESYRQSKRDKLLQAKPRPKQLDPTWYTDNIYSNRSDDMDEDYVPDCLKYGPFRTLRDIHELDEKTGGMGGTEERRVDGEGSPGYGLHRSKSCKEFQYPKSQSWCFEGNVFEAGGGVASGSGSSGGPAPPAATASTTTTTTSILKNRAGVPKSYSFSATTKTMPFDIIDYELPPASNTRREKREALRRNMNALCSSSLDRCCARDQCTSARCLLEDIYPGSGSRVRPRAADWLFEERMGRQRTPAAPTVICCCSAAEDCCCHRQRQAPQPPLPPARPRSRPICPGHHPAAEEEEHMHCRYDTDLEHFIRAERERLLLQDKFLDEDERYLAAAPARSPGRRYPAGNYHRPPRSKSLLEMQPPTSLFDEDTCSDTTEIDLEDFNIDLEKYWEQLDKPPSPINMDMRRNMHSSLKVKNVNVRCYNNGQPIDLHDREHERLMIKKSLLEGMPSPPQLDSSESSFFDSAPAVATAPAPGHAYHHRTAYGAPQGYGHKVYPTVDTLPSYQYNNFYPEHSHPTVGSVLTQQPTAGIHHPSAGGHSALSLINNIFSIYKPNKYSPENCQMNYESKPEPCKKMNVPSTHRPLGAASHPYPAPSGHDYMHSSMKRPLLISADQPHFKIIPEKTGLKISPLLSYEDYGGGGCGGGVEKQHHRLSSTARPLMLPH
ncbi:hypothetical protein M5D96_007173 [Drosophila gunungcola]|uniref:Uncharacterized protein n=2 Tax=Drosophila gunungcola TaxID=103775 RepID=A0A9P9YMQ1_9MUSC|nr:hypothetical protein M5D96_007173 [Drosophila gunungcola]